MKGAVLLLVLALAGPYLWAPLYDFPGSAPFSGSRLLNPYARLAGTWQRANLHAHGRAWSGLTNGRQSDHEIAERYHALGYSVAGVSNYQKIAAFRDVPTLPLYEHGYNVGKHHQLAVGARAVEWFDFPFWQSTRHQQFVIDRVRRKADLVVLAHPSSRDAYTIEDLQQLTGYELIEVVNGPFAVEEVWDAALSAGRPIWAAANDDTHDLDDSRRTATGWNMIDAASPSIEDIVDALRAGRSYAVLRTGTVEASNLTTVASVEVVDGTLTVRCAGTPANFTFVGQSGVKRKTVKGVIAASYAFADTDSYIRTVIETPQTILYLNPVIRYDGIGLSNPVATVDTAGTWLFRSFYGATAAGLILARRRWRRLSVSTKPQRVLSDAERETA